jgi:pimeloyl-ACP methyl ester carboxylesterase
MPKMPDPVNSVEPVYRFRTTEGQTAFMAAYDRILAQWPVPYEAIFVPTRLGATHILVSGPEDGPPLVLLHGFSTTATIWRDNVAALNRSHRIYLVDIVGLPNKSGGHFPRSKGEAVAWLADVFDELGAKPYLGGFSFGGWLTLCFAMAAPERVRGIVPMACGLGRLRWLPLARATAGAILMVLRPSRARIEGLWRYLSASGDWIENEFLDLAYLGWKHLKPVKGVLPSPFSDGALRELDVPTLLLEGDLNPTYSAQSAVDRARRLIPHIQAEVIAGAGEMLPIEQPDAVNRHILAFLQKTAS